MITKFKKQLEPLVAIIAYPFLSWNPHVLTLVSVLFSVIFAYALTNHNYILAGISWIGVIFDALDGYVARKRNKVTKFGAFFDSTMDRIADFFYISAFGFSGIISWPIVVAVLMTTFLISYIKARGENLLERSQEIKEGIMQRTERLVTLFIIFLLVVENFLQFALILFVLLLVLNLLTCLQRIIIFKKLL